MIVLFETAAAKIDQFEVEPISSSIWYLIILGIMFATA